MNDIRLDDELFDLPQAAAYLRKSPRTVRLLIKNKRLKAGKSGANGGGSFEILKSACLEYIHSNQHNQAVNAENGQAEKESVWRSNKGTASGTVISFARTGRELDAALVRQTRNKRRNSSIS